jgi:hypothetical protein
MAERIEQYSSLIEDENGVSYKVEACGDTTPSGLWKGWLEFYPLESNLPVLRTERETTQPNRKALEYWATGLEPIYFEGAFERAHVKQWRQSAIMERQRLEAIEQYIFSLFQRRKVSRVLTKEVFESTSEFSNGDLVRAFEDLEKSLRLLVRYTREGNDWLSLTPEGAKLAGVTINYELHIDALPHPPKSSTAPPRWNGIRRLRCAAEPQPKLKIHELTRNNTKSSFADCCFVIIRVI